MEHLTNCHGEWNALFAFASSLPVMGAWVHYYIGGNNDQHKH